MKQSFLITVLAVAAFTIMVPAASASGPFGVGPLAPIADGTYQQWVPSPSTSDHSTLVDEAVCNGTTDRVYTRKTNRRESYEVSLASVPDGATITDIGVAPCASRYLSGSPSTTHKMDVFYRLNGMNFADGGNYTLTGTTPVELGTTTYSGLSITKTPSTTLEIGAYYRLGTKGAQLSRLVGYIVYTLPTPDAPSDLFASTSIVWATTTEATLYWQDNSNDEDGFVVEKSTDGNSYSFAADTTNTYWTDYIGQYSAYYYRVKAYNSYGSSDYSNAIYVEGVQ